MQTRAFPVTPDALLPRRGGDPVPDGRRDRRHDPLHRPAWSGKSGDRPRYGERVLARSLGRGADLGDETAQVKRRPFWKHVFPSTFRSGPHSSIAAPVSPRSSSSVSRCRPGPATRRRRSSRGLGNRPLPKVDDRRHHMWMAPSVRRSPMSRGRVIRSARAPGRGRRSLARGTLDVGHCG